MCPTFLCTWSFSAGRPTSNRIPILNTAFTFKLIGLITVNEAVQNTGRTKGLLKRSAFPPHQLEKTEALQPALQFTSTSGKRMKSLPPSRTQVQLPLPKQPEQGLTRKHDDLAAPPSPDRRVLTSIFRENRPLSAGRHGRGRGRSWLGVPQQKKGRSPTQWTAVLPPPAATRAQLPEDWHFPKGAPIRKVFG